MNTATTQCGASMTLKGLTAIVLTIVVSMAALASEQRKMHIEIAVDDDTTGQEFSFNSDDMGFDLQQMQVGESQTITDDSGNAALVTRTEGGFQFDVDGKTIDIPSHTSEDGLVVIEMEDVVEIENIDADEEHKVIIIRKEIKEVDVAN
jgi:hypothetical protein